MSVQIVIKKNGVFTPVTTHQFDLVFWFNEDTKAHYPIPGCRDLRVAPGQTSAAYQPFPDPTLPLTITYGCAIHPAESGSLTVNPDPGQTTIGRPPGPKVKTIHITAGGVFETVNVPQADRVEWRNNDSQAHFPVPNCTGLRVVPNGVSNELHPAPPLFLPMTLDYGCAIPGHEAERGQIHVFNNFVLVQPPTLSAQNPAAPAATGGKSPYTIVQDPNVPYIITLEIPGIHRGVGVMLIQPPPPGTPFVDYRLNAADDAGTHLDTTIRIHLI